MEAAVLVGSADDLREFGARADVPARFFRVYEGDLRHTASPDGEDGLDALLDSASCVGMPLDLLRGNETKNPTEAAYRRNLHQKLAARSVLALWILRRVNPQDAATTWIFNSTPGSRMGEIVLQFRADSTLQALVRTFDQHGLQFGIQRTADTARLCLRWANGDRALETPREAGYPLLDLLGLQASSDGLVSEPFDAALAAEGETLSGVLQFLQERREEQQIAHLHAVWSATRQSMQVDTRTLGRFELVIVATRPLTARDKEVWERSFGSADSALTKVRSWIMTDSLSVAGDSRTAVAARYVWPDAVSFLLARLMLLPAKDDLASGGLYTWRAVGFGPKFDFKEMERLRDSAMQRILEEVDEAGDQPISVGDTGPLQPLMRGRSVQGAQARSVDWFEGQAAAVVARSVSEAQWRSDYRGKGAEIAMERAKPAKQQVVRLNGSSEEKLDGRDPERAYSQSFWREVRKSPGRLRSLANGQDFRTGHGIVQQIQKHLNDWNQSVLAKRRALAIEREVARQQAEELDRARAHHLALGWRLLVGFVVAVFAGYFTLSLLGLLSAFSSGTWATGIWIVVAGFVGAWTGALLPMWLERKAGQSAAATVDARLAAVDGEHKQAVAATCDLMVDGDHLRQRMRKLAVQARTTLLANRAWSIVRATRTRIAQDIAKRRLVDQPMQIADERERLALEDRRNWREASLVQLQGALPANAYQRQDWIQAVEGIKTEFVHRWATAFEQEDARMTGFLRKRALERLVQDLSEELSSKLFALLLQIARKNCESSPGTAAAPDALSEAAWAELIRGRLGRDASGYALFSVRFEALANRTPGTALVRMFGAGRQSDSLADRVWQELSATGGPLQACKFTACGDSMPLSLFGFLFEELGVSIVSDSGTIQLKPVPAGGIAGAQRDGLQVSGGAGP
jgi:hypothetical protein